MQNLDDSRFEIYLKKFRPLAPAPFSLDVQAKPPEKRRHLGITVWAFAAAMAVLGALLVRLPAHRVPNTEGSTSGIHVSEDQPLTLRLADRTLANSPSFEVALDSLESASAQISVPKGKGSALAALSKEN